MTALKILGNKIQNIKLTPYSLITQHVDDNITRLDKQLECFSPETAETVVVKVLKDLWSGVHFTLV